MKSKRKNKEWMRNPDQLKHPKQYLVNMIRNRDGSFHIVGGGAVVNIRKNQHSSEWHNVDVRDLAVEMRNNPIKTF